MTYRPWPVWDDPIGPGPDDPFWSIDEADRHLLLAVVLAGLALVGLVLGIRRLLT
ncbi:MAG: hypothetical protein Q7O66_04510 [Dehalococcoidia bacterium]|nr:hypothetical protein [Dehalococcoidia bacterium]